MFSVNRYFSLPVLQTVASPEQEEFQTVEWLLIFPKPSQFIDIHFLLC
jgi:hypothetical protein